MTNFARLLYNLSNAMRRVYWDKKKLQDYQRKRIKSAVRYAYDFVPFYHRLYRELKVDVSQVQGAEDLVKLPIVRKDDLRREDPNQLVSKEFNLQQLKAVRSSGSTGKPFQVLISGAEDDWRKAIYMRANISCGQKLRDRWVVLTAPHHFQDTTNIQRKLRIFAQTCVSIYDSSEEKIRQIVAAKPNVLDGYSGALFLLAKEVEQKELDSIRPRVIFGSAEFIDENSRRSLERVFKAPFCDQFGCSEIDRSAWQCLERTGYHMDVDSVITQFVDKEGEEVSSGERGEVVYTSLFNFAMPLIRYAVGDVAVPSESLCSCGRTLPMMKVVEGRKDSFLILPNDVILSPRVFTTAMSAFSYYNAIEQFCIRQRRKGYFEIYIKKKNDIDEKKMAAELSAHLRSFLNLSGEIMFKTKFVDEVPRSKSGKLMAVSSDLKPNW
jgi:phenylacetate-CoA ligase